MAFLSTRFIYKNSFNDLMKGSGKKGEKGGLSHNIKQGFIAVKDNLNLFLPDIFLGLIILIMALLFVFINDFTSLFMSLAKTSETARLSVIQSYFANLQGNTYALWRILISMIAFVLIGILVGVKFNSIKYDMMKDYVEGKKVSFVQSYKMWTFYFRRVLIIKILLFLIFAVVLLAVLLIVTLLGILVYKFTWGKVLLVALGLLLIFIGFVWVKLLTLFVYPVLFLDRDFTAVKAMKKSFEFFKKNKKYVVSVFLIIVGISILASIITSLINSLSSWMQGFGAGSAVIVVVVFISLLNALIRGVIVLWADLFLFLNYKRN